MTTPQPRRPVTELLTDESGASSIEYGLIATVVGVSILVGLGLYSGSIQNLWGYVRDAVLNAL